MKGKYSQIFAILAALLILASIFILTDRETIGQRSIKVKGETFIVDVADEPREQIKGLSGRKSLEQNEGMLFTYDRSQTPTFWMKGMLFNIDLLWIKNHKVVGWQKNMKAPEPNTADEDLIKYTSPEEIDAVLELSQGTIERLNIRPGDLVEIYDTREMAGN